MTNIRYDHDFFQLLCFVKVLMLDEETLPKNFEEINPIDRDLITFTITNLSLVEENKTNLVYMSIKLKRKVSNELLTTYRPTSLLLFISFVSIFFDRKLLGYVLAVNPAIILVIIIIFTSKMEELPTTSDTKMIDLWLIFCLVVPFLEVLLRTAIECLNCSCHICEKSAVNKAKAGEEEIKKEGKPSQEVSSGGAVPCVWFRSGAKVAPRQVCDYLMILKGAP